VLDGSSRVDGLALGLSGSITDQWQVFANYTYLKSKVLRSVSRFTINSGGIDALAGSPLPDVPEHSGSLWTTYSLPLGFTVGYGVTYQGVTYLARTTPYVKAPSYWLHKAMVSYQVTDQALVQLNVNNLFDKEYYTRIRNNGWATPGDGRSVVATINYMF
jgi:catecholate siderophore receptor